MGELNWYEWVAYLAVLIGGICWGFVGLFNAHILTFILGDVLGRLTYIAVGVSAGYLCYSLYLKKAR